MGDRTTLGAGAVYCGVFPLLLYTAYATFYMRQDVMPALPLAAFCLSMAVIHGGNALLLRRGPTLPMLVGLNGVLCGGALVLILTLSRFYGAGQVFFALCLIAAGCVISIYTAFSLISIPKLLTQCDVLTLATVWMCLLEASGAIPVTTLFYYLAALLLVLASLLALRTFGGTRDVVYGSRLQGAALSIGLLALIGGSLYLFVHFLSGASRAAVTALLHTIGAFFAAAGRLLNQFVQWLAQFWTPSEMEVSPPATDPLGSGASTEDIEAVILDSTFFLVLGILLAVLAAGVLLFFLFRLRKKRIRLEEFPQTQYHKAPRRKRRSGVLVRRLKALLFRLRFQMVFLLRRSSPTGLLVWLERWGRRRQLPRRPGETPRAYLTRLAALPELADRPELLPLFSQLADALDLQYFRQDSHTALPPRLAASLRALMGRAGPDSGSKS